MDGIYGMYNIYILGANHVCVCVCRSTFALACIIYRLIPTSGTAARAHVGRRRPYARAAYGLYIIYDSIMRAACAYAGSSWPVSLLVAGVG